MIKRKASQLVQEARIKVNIESTYFNTHYSRFNYLAKRFVKKSLRGKKVLEIGCYPPFLFSLLKDLGAEVFGIAGPHQKVKAKNVKIADLNQGKIPFKDDFFDLVVFSEVLEHLYCSPLKILQEVKRVLKKKGVCLLTTPNATSGLNRFRLLFGVNIFAKMESVLDEKDGIYAPCHWHHREYTMRELKTLAISSGFQFEEGTCFTSFSPFRPGKRSFLIKGLQMANFILTKIFPPLGDTIYLELTKG